jgi:taurine dioxygenase
MKLEALSGACGAVATGLNLRNELTSVDLEELTAAFQQYLVVVFPRQSMTASEQATFTRRFGPPSRVPFIRPIPEHRDVIAISRLADEPPAFDPAGSWHSDFSFLPDPPSYTVIQAVLVPPAGGDTIWANQYLAYETLSNQMQLVLTRLSGVHSAVGSFAPSRQAAFDTLAEADVVTSPEAFDTQVHPVVAVHPGSRRAALYVNREYTIGLDGMTAEESAPLLSFLFHHTTREDFTCRWRWRTGDVVVWDNRCLQHMAMTDYRGHPRRMLRTTVCGEAAQGVMSTWDATSDGMQ